MKLTKSLKWEFLIASRYLVSKNRDGFLSVIAGFSFLGICLGVAILIIVMSVMGGFREELLSRIIGMKGHVVVYNPKGNIKLEEGIIEKIKNIDCVTYAFPMVERQSVIISRDNTRGGIIMGLEKDTLIKRDILRNSLTVQDSVEGFLGDVVIVGKRMAEAMFLNVGDRITIMNPEGDNTPFGVVPRQLDFKIIGFFEVGMTEFDKNFILMPLETSQEFFKLDGSFSKLDIFTNDLGKNESIVKNINNAVEENGLEALGWQHSDSSFFQALQIEKNVMFLILTLIILIASFNIISGLVMLVKDKTRDIAIMKTVGASKASLMRIFLMTGSVIGVFGTCLGVFLGVLVTLNIESIVGVVQKFLGTELFNAEIYFLSSLPHKLDAQEISFIALISIMLSVLATIYPSLRAAKLDPVAALRAS